MTPSGQFSILNLTEMCSLIWHCVHLHSTSIYTLGLSLYASSELEAFLPS
ncbi:hypothetical protein TacPo2_41 [Pantoea bacteriophage TacPo2]